MMCLPKGKDALNTIQHHSHRQAHVWVLAPGRCTDRHTCIRTYTCICTAGCTAGYVPLFSNSGVATHNIYVQAVITIIYR